MAILNQRQIAMIRNHRYVFEGIGILAFAHKIFDWVAEKLPRRLAPNAVTIIGVVSTIIPCSLVSYYEHIGDIENLQNTANYCALGFLMWLVCDNVDGKLARLRGLCSPFGELLDHGGDCFALLFSSLTIACFLRVSENALGLFLWFISDMCINYITEPYTIILCGMYKIESFDFTEVMLAFISIAVASAWYGLDVWTYEIFPALGFQLRYIFYGVKFIILGDLLFGKTRIFYTAARQSGKLLEHALKPLAPALITLLSATIAFWNCSEEFIEHNKIPFLLCFGFSFIKEHIQLIVVHMTKSKLKLLDYAQLFPVFIAYGIIFCKTPSMERNLVLSCLVIISLDTVIYFVRLQYELYRGLNETLFILEDHSSSSSSSSSLSSSSSASSSSSSTSSFIVECKHVK